MEQQFLDQYHQCKTRFVAKEFDDLDHEDLKAFQHLRHRARQIFKSIIRDRKLGEKYDVAALTYFGVDLEFKNDNVSYLVFRSSYFIYALYEKIAELADSQAKQKEVFDLLRFIAKPLIQNIEAELDLKDESQRLLQCFIQYMLKLKDGLVTFSDWDNYSNNQVFNQTKIRNYLHDYANLNLK